MGLAGAAQFWRTQLLGRWGTDLMNEHHTLHRLRADRELCRQCFRPNATVLASATALFGALHLILRTDLLITVVFLAGLWPAAAGFGTAYLILGWHIRRISRD